jgi:hypothetical protein
LGEALNATNLVWETYGSAPWLPETIWTHDGVDAAAINKRSGGGAWLETSVSGPSTLTFAWLVNTDPDSGYLRFYIDGFLQSQITGNPGWQTKTFTITGSGIHTLQWEYDGVAVWWVGDSVGYLDEVSFSSSKAQQFITFAPANCPVGWAPFALSATASSGLPVTFTQMTGPPLLAGNILTPSTPGTLLITASQAGNASFAPAPPVTMKVVVVGSNLVDVLPLGVTTNFSLVAYGNGRFLAVGPPHWYGMMYPPMSVFSSPDGLNWTALEPTFDPTSDPSSMVGSPSG